jgi:N-acyl homoserine lactone hydrolase
MLIGDVRRIPLGTFTRPPEETGTGRPRVEGVYGYLVRHERGLVLLDTGMGRGDDGTEAWYQPQRVALPDALASAGVGIDDLVLVANCHLHFDHCGGNPLLGARTPVLCQRTELDTARAGDYTFDHLLDGPTYELLDGETEPLPGLHVIPTPGHVDGHQSLVVECADGTVVLAGQSHDNASLWSADALALPLAPPWMERLLAFDPKRVVFAHDAAVWEPR